MATMNFATGAPTRRLKVLAQDPTIVDADGLPLFTAVEVLDERLTPGPKGSRVHVVDYDVSRDRMIAPRRGRLQDDLVEEAFEGATSLSRRRAAAKALIADPHFHAQNVFALISSTLLDFERALGRRISWGFASRAHQLKVAPHAFAEMNAFYSREDEMLLFGYFPDPSKPKAFVFTCLSYDIVVHETTHAILDGLRSEYSRPASVDQGAFHEAFADIVALLSAFKSEELIDFALGGRGEEKTAEKHRFEPAALRETILLGLAEQFGEALAETYQMSLRGDALRRSAEMKPGRDYYHDPALRAEEHDFGEVLVAPIMNTFLEIWSRRVAPLDPVSSGRVDRARAVEEGAKAAMHLLTMCIRALDYLPPANVTFPDYLSAILTSDEEVAPDDSRYGYRDALSQSFKAYGITRDRGADAKKWATPEHGEKLVYGFAGHAEMQWDREAMHRFLWQNATALELHDEAFTRIISVRPVVRRGPDGAFLRETVVEYLQTLDIFASELGRLGLTRPDGMATTEFIRLVGGGTLLFNDYGVLKYHVGTGVASDKQQERLQSLWDLGAFDKDRASARRFAQLHLDRALGASYRKRTEQW